MNNFLSMAWTPHLAAGLLLAAAAPLAAEPPAEPKIKWQRGVEYLRHGELSLKADLYLPQGEGPFPAVLMIHGGGWVAGSKWNLLEHANYAARRGYVVVSINYRLAPTAKFPAQIHDCKEAVRWMRRNAGKYRIDPRRIAAYGYSSGGHLAALLGLTTAADGLEGESPAGAAKVSTRVSAVVAGGAPCEFRDLPENSIVLAYFLGGTRAEQPDTYRLASPAAHASADDPPVFMFHGSSDALVSRRSAEALREAMQKAGGRCQFHVVEGKGHLGAFLDVDSRRRAVDFLDRVLKDN